MEEQTKGMVLWIFGIFFIFYGLLAVVFEVYRGRPDSIFWYCYLSMVLIGIGSIKRSGVLIASQLSILFVYLVGWNVDFLYQAIFRKSLFGITDFFFNYMIPTARFISFEHLFLLPIGFFLLYLIKAENKDHWKFSIVQFTLIVLVTYFLANPERNVNCVFYSCVSFIPTFQFYSLLWFFLGLSSIFISASIINKMKFLHVQEKINPRSQLSGLKQKKVLACLF